MSNLENPQIAPIKFLNADQVIGDKPQTSMTKIVNFFSGISILRWVLIFTVLSYLGINIFTYLGNVTTDITDILKDVLHKFGGSFGYKIAETTKQTVQTTALGTKEVVDIAANIVTGSIDTLEDTISTKNNLDKALSDAIKNEPEPDISGSRTQINRSGGKPGYCYIGTDRGFRSCLLVNDPTMCMSGDIFPTDAICKNPTLRE